MRYDFHRGIDIPAPPTRTVFAITSGVVAFAGDDEHFDDDVMQIAHCLEPNPPDDLSKCSKLYLASYHHMDSKYAVSSGQKVRVGDVVGKVEEGADNLHFEIRVGDDNKEFGVHPLTYLPHPDRGAPDVTIGRVDFSDLSAVEVEVTARRPMDALDLIAVEVELQALDGGEMLSRQHYDANEWNLIYTDDGNTDENPFNDIEVTPEDLDHNSTEHVVHFRFFGLSSPLPRDRVRVIARGRNARGQMSEIVE